MNYTTPAKNIAATKAGNPEEDHSRIFLDLETTGFIEDGGEIIQLAYIVDGKDRGVYNEYYAPKNGFNYEAMGKNRITPEMLEGKDPLTDNSIAYDRLNYYNSEENTIVIHNAPFDLKMLAEYGFENRTKVIDTLRCARHLLPNAQRHNLSTLFFQYGLYRQMGSKEKQMNTEFDVSLKRLGAHNALYDIVMLQLLFEHLLDVAGSEEKLVEYTKKPVFVKKPLGFGKHKGKTYEEIGHEDKGYLEWMLEKFDKLNDDDRYTINCILNNETP